MSALEISDLPEVVTSYLTASQGTDPGSAITRLTIS
jgi:hypothetical protein